jgi:hypothetical protein
MTPSPNFVDKHQRYSRDPWLPEANFCYETQDSVVLKPMLTIDGYCYSFNMNDKLFKKSM